MPRRGYRKGISDGKTPLGRRIHTRLPDTIHRTLMADAASRSLPASKILRNLAAAHYAGERLEMPHARGPSSAAIRELARLGNNINQIAREANRMRLNLLQTEARVCLRAVREAMLSL